MPRPTSATTISRPDLRSTAMEFLEKQDEFLGTKILPFFDVEEQSGEYPVIPVEALLNVPDTKRAPRGNYARDDWEFENDNYDCVENGWEEPVDDVEEKLYARFFDAEEIATNRALSTILRVQEKRIADMLFNAGNFTAHAITNEWDNNHYTDAIPITDVKTGRKAIHDACGLEPNTLIIAYNTFLHLGLMNQIVDRLKYTHAEVKRGDIPAELLATAFGVERVLIGKGRYNSAKKGQTAVLADIWNDEYAMLCVTSSVNDIKTPSLGRTFRWTKDCPQNVMVESYREEQTRSDIIRARQHTDEEIILTAAAYLLSNITTP